MQSAAINKLIRAVDRILTKNFLSSHSLATFVGDAEDRTITWNHKNGMRGRSDSTSGTLLGFRVTATCW